MNTERNLCMIPGPIEYHEDVVKAMCVGAVSHVDPKFIAVMSNCLKNLRKVLGSNNMETQPLIISGSGTIGWDIAASNVVEPSENVLVASTGLFGDRFAQCLKSFAANVTEIKAKPGNIVELQVIDKYLSENKFKLLTLTHVDTSTGVVMDVGNICKFVKQKYPDVLVCIDAVCSALSEPIYFDEWNADIVLTASQKGVGVPPGLSLMLISPEALKVSQTRKSPVIGYYTSWANWVPIMKSYENKKPSYFGTPSVQLVFALEAALNHHLENGIDSTYNKHKEASDWFRSEIHNLGLKTLPIKNEYAARSMTAVYYPEHVTALKFLPEVSKQGVTIAGGIHPEIASKYFRVGHMGVAVVERNRKYLEKTINAIKHALKQ